jgi:hypothetical protein
MGYLSDAVNVSHTAAVNARVLPSRLVVSRTVTVSPDATSTHSPPLSFE